MYNIYCDSLDIVPLREIYCLHFTIPVGKIRGLNTK
jgi:hypothetical protein